MKKAMAYLRVSGAGQEPGDGFERQRVAILRFAAANALVIPEDCWFQDVHTGKDEWEKRPGWVAMMHQAGVLGVRVILIEKLDRLARDLMVQEHIIADLRLRRVDLISSMEPDLCVDDPTRNLLRQIMGAISSYDRAMLTLKMRGARERIRAAGKKCEGRKAYGESLDKPEERATLAFMKACRAGGMTYEGIAKELNTREEFRDTRRGAGRGRLGTEWIGAVVCKILRREGVGRGRGGGAGTGVVVAF